MSVQASIKDGFAKLLQREVDRKDFLKLAGIAVIASIGVGTFFKVIFGQKQSSQSSNKTASRLKDISYGGKDN
ncbi:MAG: hypothetical protein WAR37_04045 [Candidatus Microsaccharimonas sp.]